MTSFIRVRRILIRLLSWMLNKKASGIPALYLKQHKKCRRCYRRFPAQPLLTRRELTQLSQTGFQAQPGGGFVNGMVASHLLCHSGTINRHSLNGAL
ncbi:hypothetical protein F1D79_27685, partial [Klebsiella pneumoniae]